MKWVVLVALIALVPLMATWFRDNRRNAHFVWTIMGAMPFVYGPWHLNASPISWALWPGYVRGIEISALDTLALAVILSGYPKGFRLPLRWPMILYFVAVVAAIPHANQMMAGNFYAWQLIRMFLVFAAAARIASEERGAQALLTGMILGLTIQTGYAISARAGGALQTGGTLGHQNLLGFISHMVLMPCFALVLAGNRTKLGLWGLAMGAIAVVLTASRATIGLSAAGFAITYVLSAMRHWSPRKAAVGLFALVALGVVFPFAQQSLERRFVAQGTTATSDEGEYSERKAFEKAAKMMMADHPLGVGPNMYVQVANLGGYSDRAGVIWAFGSRSANVHNSYLLVGAETGYPGMIAFILLIGSAIIYALRSAWRNRNDLRGELLVGIAGGFIIMAIHALYEWAFVISPSQYMYALSLGLIAGIARQMAQPKSGSSTVQPRPKLVGLPVVRPRGQDLPGAAA
ncbi:MAG: O-antigen ligase family protein [Proteobacteria bacterium]|nr:O-antigen ligase family protein [Pseudomonadota bacterium]